MPVVRSAKTHRSAIRVLLVVLGGLLLAGALSSSAWGAGASTKPTGGGGTTSAGGTHASGGPTGGVGSSPSGPTGSKGHTSHQPTGGPLGRTGMWIWYVSQSAGGNLSSIIAMARQHAVGTVIVKSGDGSTYWSQFSSHLVSTLHAGGLDVCAWQYVYGSHPKVEAEVGARAVQAGADCLLIDAEGEYQGRYAAAQTYLTELRTLVGASFPLGLASFPYVDYHPSFPYSVFLGPGGAQYNVPQMYWRDIGTTTDAVYSHTWVYNTPYLRPIAPLGEVAGDPPPAQIERFRQLRRVYHAAPTSWWVWQSATARGWSALSATVPDLQTVTPQTGMPTLGYHVSGAIGQGDLVVWAQEHLYSAGYRVTIDGIFGTGTRTAVQQFQSAHALPVTGQVDTATWTALLRYPAAPVTWTSQGATAASARGAGAARAGGLALAPPRSARLRAVHYEIPRSLGSG